MTATDPAPARRAAASCDAQQARQRRHRGLVPLALAVAMARLVRLVSRALGRGGTTLPGRVLLALRGDALPRLARRLDHGSVLISATNGKTTTAAMLAHVLDAAGFAVVHNQAGSNLIWGVGTALLGARRGAGQIGIFEVDEAWLGAIARAVAPRVVVLANLFRDQLDRYGELERLADDWYEVVRELSPTGTRFVLASDDPLVADLAGGVDRASPPPLYFGIEDDTCALAARDHAADATHCRLCGAPYRYRAVWAGHLGRYECANCGHRRPDPDIAAERVVLEGTRGTRIEIRDRPRDSAATVALPLPGLYNAYNALACTAAARSLGVDLARSAAALATFRAAFGRVETVELDGRELVILLIKNPAGANAVLRTLALEEEPLCLWIALNDGVADGRDVSWIWDADFELLRGRVRSVVCSGSRAPELALRLKYAELEAPIAVQREMRLSLEEAVRNADRRLYVLPTYTALLDIRTWLAKRGAVAHWARR